RETKARLYVARLLRRRRGRIAARAEDEDERKQNPALQDEQKSNDAEVEHKLSSAPVRGADARWQSLDARRSGRAGRPCLCRARRRVVCCCAGNGRAGI